MQKPELQTVLEYLGQYPVSAGIMHASVDGLIQQTQEVSQPELVSQRNGGGGLAGSEELP